MDNIHKAFSADFLSEEIKKNYKNGHQHMTMM